MQYCEPADLFHERTTLILLLDTHVPNGSTPHLDRPPCLPGLTNHKQEARAES